MHYSSVGRKARFLRYCVFIVLFYCGRAYSLALGELMVFNNDDSSGYRGFIEIFDLESISLESVNGYITVAEGDSHALLSSFVTDGERSFVELSSDIIFDSDFDITLEINANGIIASKDYTIVKGKHGQEQHSDAATDSASAVNGAVYTVQKRDYLGGLAERLPKELGSYKTRLNLLLSLNGLSPNDSLKVGQNIILPSVASAQQPTKADNANDRVALSAANDINTHVSNASESNPSKSQLGGDMEAVESKLSTMFDEKTANLVSADQLATTVKTLTNDLASASVGFNTNLQQEKAQLSSEIESVQAEFTTIIDERTANLVSADQLASTVKTLADNLALTKADFNTNLQNEKTQLSSEIDAVQAKLAAAIDERTVNLVSAGVLATTVKALADDLASTKADFNAELLSEKTRLSGQMEDERTSSIVSADKLATTIKALSDDLASTKAEFNTDLKNEKAQLISEIETVQAKLVTAIDERTANLASADQLEKLADDLASTKADFDTNLLHEKTRLSSEMEDERTSSSVSADQLATTIKTLADDLVSTKADFNTDLQNEKAQLSNEIEAVQTKFTTTLDERTANLVSIDQLTATEKALADGLVSTKADFDTDLQQEKAQLSSEIEAVQAKLATTLDERTANLVSIDQLTAAEKALADDLASTKAGFNTDLQNEKAQRASEIEAAQTKFTTTLDERTANLASVDQLTATEKALADSLASTKADFDTDLQQEKAQLSSEIEAVQTKLATVIDERTANLVSVDQLAATEKALADGLASTKADFDTDLQQEKAQLSSEIEAVQTKLATAIDERTANLVSADQLTDIEKALADGLASTQADFNTNLQNEKVQLSNEIEAVQTKLATAIDERTANLVSADQLETTEKALLKDLVSSMAVTIADLDTNLQRERAQLRSEIDAVQTKLITTIDERTANLVLVDQLGTTEKALTNDLNSSIEKAISKLVEDRKPIMDTKFSDLEAKLNTLHEKLEVSRQSNLSELIDLLENKTSDFVLKNTLEAITQKVQAERKEDIDFVVTVVDRKIESNNAAINANLQNEKTLLSSEIQSVQTKLATAIDERTANLVLVDQLGTTEKAISKLVEDRDPIMDVKLGDLEAKLNTLHEKLEISRQTNLSELIDLLENKTSDFVLKNTLEAITQKVQEERKEDIGFVVAVVDRKIESNNAAINTNLQDEKTQLSSEIEAVQTKLAAAIDERTSSSVSADKLAATIKTLTDDLVSTKADNLTRLTNLENKLLSENSDLKKSLVKLQSKLDLYVSKSNVVASDIVIADTSSPKITQTKSEQGYDFHPSLEWLFDKVDSRANVHQIMSSNNMPRLLSELKRAPTGSYLFKSATSGTYFMVSDESALKYWLKKGHKPRKWKAIRLRNKICETQPNAFCVKAN